MIKVSSLSNNAGPSTDDRVFLLSIDEAESLFAGDNDRIMKPTAYAIESGAYTFGGNAWWLRSRGNDANGPASVCDVGDIYYDGSYVSNGFGSVRPAFRIAI